MTPLPHHYDVQLTAGLSGYAQLASAGIPALRAAPPVDYGGPGDAWTPEHLLLAAVQTCFLFTFRAVARAARVEFIALDVHAAGTVDRKDGVTRFTAITLRAKVAVPAGTDRDRLLHALEKSERACLVSASLSTPIRLEPEITEHSAVVTTAYGA